MALYNAPTKPLAQGESTRDYKHAAKLFLSDNYRLAPKQSFLYYVCLNINQNVLSNLMGMGISSQPIADQYETGMMVKSVELPKFSIDTKTLNAYNRKNVVQNKIQYDPITLTFHDDAANVVLNFWNDYYTYYYRDSDYEPGLYKVPHKYDLRQRQGWGYGIRNANLEAFLSDIQIFSLNQKRFTEYRLINPTISNWKHGELRASEGNGTVESAMTVAYETVKYRTGYINAVDVNGFALLHYDNESSPISESTTNIYTTQGIPGVIGGGATDLSRPDGTIGGAGLLSNYLSMQRAYQNLKSVDWTTVAQQSLSQIGASILNGAINGAYNAIFVPTMTSYTSGTYATGGGGVNYSGNPYAYGTPTNAVYSNGNIIGSATGAIAGSYLGYTNNSYAVSYNTQPNNGTVVIGADGQPRTGTVTAVVLDPSTGEIIPGVTTTSTLSGTGGWVKSDPNQNLVQTSYGSDSAGNMVVYRQYANGETTATDFNTGEDSTALVSGAVQQGTITQTPTSYPGQYVQYGVNPATGVMNSVNSIPIRISNTVVGGVVNGVINPITNTINGAINTATNTFIDNVISPVNGMITQGINSVTGSIENVISTAYGSVSLAASDLFDSNQDKPYEMCYAIDNFDGTQVPQDTTSSSDWWKED